MRLVARYPSREALAADVDSQLGHGGLLVRGDVPRGVEQFAGVELVVAAGTEEITVAAQVLQFFPGVGVAVSVDATARERIAALAAAPPAVAVVAPVSSVPPAQVDDPGSDADTVPVMPRTKTGEAPAGDADTDLAVPRARTAEASTVAKIQQALKGDRETRFAILRDANRSIHIHVLRNPGLRLDEVAAIARMTSVSVEALAQIAARREWGHRPEIAIALVRNPTVPVPVAIELLAYVTPGDLQQLAKDTRTRDPVQRAARKRLLK